ncbi:MAG: hypothetical protein K8R36_00065, partial [Planctomycetales bacterium]|nr:hypothetical protein [Planctomycetales bacterium]
PRSRQHERPAGEVAVAAYVAEAQINFLLQQTLHEIEESRKDKVTTKAGMRKNEIWKEVTTAGRQIVPVGLLNVALRLTQAKAKLVGVDVTGRMQQEMFLAEERLRRAAMARGQEAGVRVQGTGDRGQESEVRRDEEVTVRKPLMKKNEKSEVVAENVQPQVEAAHEDKLRGEKEEFVKNSACKQLINHLRRDPECVGWTDEQIQEHAQYIWDTQEEDAAVAAKLAWSQRANPHPGPLPREEREESGDFPKGDILPVSGGTTKRTNELRRRRDKRHSPQERRRDFLAPLAVG